MTLPRDLIGYGGSPPNVSWPNNAKIAVSFVINYEEGGEKCILNGDDESESYLVEIPGLEPLQNDRHLLVESTYEYGSRAGIYRLLNLFREHKLKTTIYAVAKALEKNPRISEVLMADGHDISSHHYRWFNYRDTAYQTERAHLAKVMAVHKELCGDETPKGMYIGSITKNTKRILYEYNDSQQDPKRKILWHSDCYNDDVPYWDYAAFLQYARNKVICGDNVPMLNIPYTLTVNDMRYLLPNGYVTSDEWFQFAKDSFDELVAEGGKMMTIGLHPRIAGHPGRVRGLRRFIEYITSKEVADKV